MRLVLQFLDLGPENDYLLLFVLKLCLLALQRISCLLALLFKGGSAVLLGPPEFFPIGQLNLHGLHLVIALLNECLDTIMFCDGHTNLLLGRVEQILKLVVLIRELSDALLL